MRFFEKIIREVRELGFERVKTVYRKQMEAVVVGEKQGRIGFKRV